MKASLAKGMETADILASVFPSTIVATYYFVLVEVELIIWEHILLELGICPYTTHFHRLGSHPDLECNRSCVMHVVGLCSFLVS